MWGVSGGRSAPVVDREMRVGEEEGWVFFDNTLGFAAFLACFVDLCLLFWFSLLVGAFLLFASC